METNELKNIVLRSCITICKTVQSDILNSIEEVKSTKEASASIGLWDIVKSCKLSIELRQAELKAINKVIKEISKNLTEV